MIQGHYILHGPLILLYVLEQSLTLAAGIYLFRCSPVSDTPIRTYDPLKLGLGFMPAVSGYVGLSPERLDH